MDLGVRDRVYAITGGTRGLGRAAAEMLAAEGARLVVSSRNAATVRQAAADLGRLDGALLSIGGPPTGQVATTGDDAWRTAFESVFLGPLRAARQIAERLDGGGAIAFVLSTSVRQPIPGLSPPTACARAWPW